MSGGTKHNEGSVFRRYEPKKILYIRNNILEGIHPEISKIDFHFDDVRYIDTSAMAMIIIVIKFMQGKRISSKVTGLNRECMDTATVLGLHCVTEFEVKS